MKNDIFLKIALILIFIFIFFIAYKNPNRIYNNNKDYQKIYKKIIRTHKIQHFPTNIPENSKNIKIQGYSQTQGNGEFLLLEFKTNTAYINNELQSHKFINNDKIGTKQKIYYFPHKNFDLSNYTFYVIEDSENIKYSKKYFPYFSGIAINMKDEKILYYYISPSD